jgi:hypothetical protein
MKAFLLEMNGDSEGRRKADVEGLIGVLNGCIDSVRFR